MVITEPVRLEFVLVPAGSFLMGSDKDKDLGANDDELPQHMVHVAEFYIGKYEVTNAQYAAFVQATGRQVPSHWTNGAIPAGKEDHPVVNVTWNNAVAFTAWFSEQTGRAFRLPTEA
jgi:formylglycine-generating enzyme required for sulfatase activity